MVIGVKKTELHLSVLTPLELLKGEVSIGGGTTSFFIFLVLRGCTGEVLRNLAGCDGMGSGDLGMAGDSFPGRVMKPARPRKK